MIRYRLTSRSPALCIACRLSGCSRTRRLIEPLITQSVSVMLSMAIHPLSIITETQCFLLWLTGPSTGARGLGQWIFRVEVSGHLGIGGRTDVDTNCIQFVKSGRNCNAVHGRQVPPCGIA